MYQVNPRVKLREQLQYLANSCDAYDAGHKSEAIRMATVARILIHDTGSSTSLLSHLSANQIPLLSTITGQPDPNMKFFHGMGMAYENSDGTRCLIPSFNICPTKTMIPAKSWWEETVFVLEGGEVLTRKSIVLAAANQDGGAHVDLKVKDNNYHTLATDGAAGTYLRATDSGYVTATASNLHLVALRQMGFELLNSTDLLKLKT